MRGKTTIKPDGSITTEVLERDEGEKCTLVQNLTDRFGKQTEETITGPDCETVYELDQN